MKLDANNAVTQINSTSGEVREFSIEVNPVAFSLLSQKLYKNPTLAVIRELLCNAYDAHVVAGTLDKPIEVGLPTSLSPEFSVTDYGTGLSDPDVMRLYTTFFASNKRDSNSTIGGFGLGSKSPFAVSDTFTVESRFNGVKSIYVATKDSGAPKLIRMASSPIDEPSGMTIRVPVASNFSYWQNETRTFASTFNHKIRGIGEYTFESEVEGNTFISGKCLFRNRHDTTYVRVGGTVCYPYSPNNLMFRGCLIEVPNGSLTISPTREELVLDDNTRTVMGNVEQGLLNLIKDEYTKRLGNLDALFDNPQEATLYAIEVAKNYIPSRVKNLVNNFATWGGKYLDSEYIPYKIADKFAASHVVSCYKVRISDGGVGTVTTVKPENWFSTTNSGGLYGVGEAYGEAGFKPDFPWFRNLRNKVVVQVPDADYDKVVTEYTQLYRKLRSIPELVKGGKTSCTINVVLLPESVINNMLSFFWLKDITKLPPNLVVNLSSLSDYQQPKRTVMGVAKSKVVFDDHYTLVGNMSNWINVEKIDYDVTKHPNGPLLYIGETYSSLTMEVKENAKQLAARLGKPILFLQKKALAMLEEADKNVVAAKWLDVSVAGNLLKAALANPLLKAGLTKRSDLFPDLEYFTQYYKDFQDKELSYYLHKLYTEYDNHSQIHYDAWRHNFRYVTSLEEAVELDKEVEKYRNTHRKLYQGELTRLLTPYLPYLKGVSKDGYGDDGKKSIVNTVNLVYNAVVKDKR